MRRDHIIWMLEENSVRRLSESEIALIGSHTAGCSDCLKAYTAARVSTALMQARAHEIEQPSPFFEKRVMASLREKRLSPAVTTLLSVWKAAGALVYSMAALIVVLVSFSLFVEGSGSEGEFDPTTVQAAYSPEDVLLEQGELTEDAIPYDQVLMTVYDSGDGDGQ